jgi:hypothetical protein
MSDEDGPRSKNLLEDGVEDYLTRLFDEQVKPTLREFVMSHVENDKFTSYIGSSSVEGSIQAVQNDSAKPGDIVYSAFMAKACALVRIQIMDRLEKTDPTPNFEVYVVWFSKVLRNWKALVSTTLPDGMYYEVTYDGTLAETYIDAYKKFYNVAVPDGVRPPELPHSRACGAQPHEHGPKCHSNCPTCGGVNPDPLGTRRSKWQ